MSHCNRMIANLQESSYFLHFSCAIKNSKFPSCIQSGNSNVQQIGLSINESSSTSLTAQATMISMSTPQEGSSNELIRLQSTSLEKHNSIPYHEILVGLDPMNPQELPNPIWFNTLCLLGFLIFFRLLGYMVLRIYHKPG